MIPIHNHSTFSALDGLSTPQEMVERCIEMGCPCCGISDHGTVAGHPAFSRTCQEYGIKPILAAELYHGVKTEGWARNERDQAHLVAGALTDEGLRNLWRLVDRAAGNFRYVGRVTWDSLSQFSEGLFATSACIQGLVSRGIQNDDLDPLNRYIEIFEDRFYLEIHTYPGEIQAEINRELVSIGQERGIPLIYATDAHFAYRDQYPIHDAYIARQTGQTLDTPVDKRKMWHPPALYMMNEEEVRQSLTYLPDSAVDEALNNSDMLADMANAALPEIRRHLPVFVPKKSPWPEAQASKNAGTLFIDLVERGLIQRYGEDAPEEVWDRAATEIETFLKVGLEHYFLQAWDLCQFCNEQGIERGPGRGSAAGAIVAYALGITDVDPLRYGLIFERFYNPGREKGYPDIDIDFPKRDRRRVSEYMSKRWGKDNVRHIGTIRVMKPKSACDAFYKTFGISWSDKEEVKSIIGQVPDIDILDSSQIGWSRELEKGKKHYVLDHVGDKLDAWVAKKPMHQHDSLNRWLDFIGTICNRVSGSGVHASGVVVSDCPLDAELPCYWSADQGIRATMFPMAEVDRRMFVKQDILGLRTLDTLAEWKSLVEDHDIRIDWSGLENNEFDEEMWMLIDQGLSLGIFQIEDRTFARQLARDLKPRSVEDLSVIVALNRPGPIRSGTADAYLRRRGGEAYEPYDPLVEPILRDTYGLFVYQEHIIALFNTLGYTLGESDAVRKILGKKKPDDLNALREGTGEWKGRGYFDMCKAAGMKEANAQTIWATIEEFALYSFNKSHAVCYGTIAFRTLFAKYMAPAEFFIACIRTNPEDAGSYVAEARRMGIEILPPHIRHSQADISIRDGKIYFGFSNIKGVKGKAVEYLCYLRDRYPLETLSDLDKAMEDEQRICEKEKKEGIVRKSPKQILRANQITALQDAGIFDEYESRTISLTQRQKLEKDLLGIIITDETQKLLNRNMDKIADCDSYDDILDNTDLHSYTLPGVVTKVKEIKSRTGNPMGFVTIEHEDQEVEFVVFANQWQSHSFLWKERQVALFVLKRNARGINFEEGIRLT